MDYDYYYTNSTASSGGPTSLQMTASAILILIIVISQWRIFTKAKQDGWKALIPIYNTYIVLKIIGKPWWWLIMLVIPIINIFFAFALSHHLAKSFGKGMGYTLLLFFLPIIGYPMLAFGDATYKGPSA